MIGTRLKRQLIGKLIDAGRLGAIMMAFVSSTTLAEEVFSVRLTDVIKSKGTGSIDLLKDVTPSQLEQLRVENGGLLVLGVDINEDASGSEKASSQGIAVKSVRHTHPAHRRSEGPTLEAMNGIMRDQS